MQDNKLSGIIREEIKRQYKSINKFAQAVGLPSSSIVTILNGRAEGTAYGTIVKILKKLDINTDNDVPIVLDSETLGLITRYNMLDDIGKHTVKAVLGAEFARCTELKNTAVTAAFGQTAPQRKISEEERILWEIVQKIKQEGKNE